MRTFVVSAAPSRSRQFRSDETERSGTRALQRCTGLDFLVVAGVPRTHFRDAEVV